MTSKIVIGTVKAKGGLNECYQNIDVILKLGEEPKVGIEMSLVDNENHRIQQRPVQIMFNRKELEKLANMRFLLSLAEQKMIRYLVTL